MKKNFQKIVCVLTVIILGISFMSGLNATYISRPIDINVKSGSTVFSTDNIEISIQNEKELITIQYLISEFSIEEVTIGEVGYKQIKLDDESNNMIKGKPDLPTICRSIIIPDNLKMDIRVTHSQFEEYEGIKIAPSKGNIMRTQNPDDVLYLFDEVYNEDTWFPKQVAELIDPYILRDFRGQVVKINPFQYNPAEGKLRFYTDITVEIYPTGPDTLSCLTRTGLPSKVDTDFNQIYNRHFINYDRDRYDPIEEQGNMIIITYDSYWDAMMPFVQWKNMRGVHTEMFNVSEIGDANAIDTFIEAYYNDYGLTFVLLVGDVQQMPTLYPGYSASDPSYSYIVGSDHYPDLFVGRFSAQNVTQVETQVERSIEYEKDPQTGAEWYHKGTGVGSNDPGIGDDGEHDWEHIRNIRTKLMNYTYTEVEELYDGSKGGEDEPGNPTPSMVATALNDGRSIVNYCGHGGPTSWSTSSFSNSNIDSLVNDNMLPFVICVACNNGQFDDYDACFCEAWLRATHNGEPTGAIAATGSSTGMSWNPPMDAQDEMVDLLVESYVDNVKYTIGGIHANGCIHMNDEYGSSGYSETDTWHVFGDPSLQIRTNIPVAMTVSHESAIPMGTLTFEVDVEGVEGALCAVSRNYELFGYGYTDDSGHAVIEFFEPIPSGDDMDIVVTAHNKIPYFGLISVSGENNPPEKPEKPTGRRIGRINITYVYTTVTTDPDDDNVYYMWDWGDGNFSEWLGQYDSGETCTELHSWSERGTYSIRVKAKDIHGMESEWSDPLSVRVPKAFSFVAFLEQSFPRIFLFLESINYLRG